MLKVLPGPQWLRFAAVSLFLTVTAGCTDRSIQVSAEPQAPLVDKPVSVFDYESDIDRIQWSTTDRRYRGYEMISFSLTGAFENGQPDNRFTGAYYYGRSPGRKPLIVVLPVWGVSEYPSLKMTNALLKRSKGAFNVLRLDGLNRVVDWKGIEHAQDYDQFTERVANAEQRVRHLVTDLRTLIDWAHSRPETDPERTGVVGFSISAIFGGLLHQVDPRISASVLLMGGAELGKIVTRCPGNEQETREAVLGRLDLDLEHYEATAARILAPVDPVTYPRRVNPRKVLLFEATEDDCIPESARLAWWQVLGKPQKVNLNYSHRHAFYAMTPLGLNYVRAETYRFLAARLLP